MVLSRPNYFLAKVMMFAQQDAVEKIQPQQQSLLLRKNKIQQQQQQQQSLRIMGTFRFRAMCVRKRKEIPPQFFKGRLFETISGYSTNPAIPPYPIALGHYTSWSTDSAGHNKVCDVTAAADKVLWKYFCVDIFFVGPPLVRRVDKGPTSK